MNTNINTIVLDIKQVSKIFGVRETTARSWAKSKKIPGYKIGKQWFFNRNAILDFQSIEDSIKVLGENAKPSHKNMFDILLKDKNLEVRIEVKSSNLRESTKGKYWRFSMLHKSENSDYYLLMGYDENRTKLLRAYFIPTPELFKYVPTITNKSRGRSYEFKGFNTYLNDKFMSGFILEDYRKEGGK